MLGHEGQRHVGNEGQRGWNDAERQGAGEPALQSIDFLAHRARVGDDAARPIQDALALRREATEARPTLDDQHAQLILEAFHRR